MNRYTLRPVLKLALALGGLTVATLAHAEPKDDARRHFRSGLEAVQAEDYDLALQHFLAAQEAYPHPSTLYNIARVYADMGDLSNALQYYRLYRDEQVEDGIDVDPVIQAIEARGGSGPSEVTAPITVPQPTGTGTGGPAVAGGNEDLSETELARLGDIQAELAALAQAFGERGAVNSAANTTAASQLLTDPDAPPQAMGPVIGGPIEGGPEMPVSEIDLDALGVGSMLTDAYERSVVTASRYGQDPLDSPSTLTVLTAEDIRLSGVTTIPELLRRVVGVDVAQMGGGHADISIRGFNRELNNKVLVLVDGRSTYWDFFGATVWPALPIVLEEIDRIEIIRGPGSAVYGANAVTGVINILTKVPGEMQEATVHVDAGTIGYRRGSVVTSGRLGDHRYKFSAGFANHGRWEKDLDLSEEELLEPDSVLQPFYADQDTALSNATLSGRVDRQFGGKGFASVSGGWSQGRWEYYNLAALPVFGMDFTHHNVRGDLSWGVVHFRSFWNSNTGYTGAWAQPADIRYENYSRIDDDSVDAEVEAPLEFSTGSVDHKFNMGLGYRYKRIALDYLVGGFDTPYNQHHLSAFVNEQLEVGILGVVGSFRIDKHPYIADITQTMSPRLAAIVRVADATALRATAGKAFRAPNALESLAEYELPTPYDGVFVLAPGDQELLPEKITTFELGIHDESTDYHVADAVVYVNLLDDAIWLPDVVGAVNFFDPDPGGFEAGVVGFENTKFDYTGYGFEAEARVFPVDGMDVFGNVDVQTVRYTEDTLPSFSIPATLKLNGGWMYRTPIRTDITLMAHYISAQQGNAHAVSEEGIVVSSVDIPERFLLSSRIGVRPTKDEKLELAVTGWNLTSPMVNDGIGWADHAKGQHLRTRIHGSVIYKF